MTLQVSNLKRVVNGNLVLVDVSLRVDTGEVLFIRGPSGVGKSLLLRSIACLDPIQGGNLRLGGKTPQELGTPAWRAQVTYVHQTRVNHAGTPAEFYFQAQSFEAQRSRPRGDLPALIYQLGLEQEVLNTEWSHLSGGQAQRVALAIAIALRPSFLLLDEPTSACDPASTLRVEQVLRECGAGLVWVTHDPEQPARVGGRALELPRCLEVRIPQQQQQQQQQQQLLL